MGLWTKTLLWCALGAGDPALLAMDAGATTPVPAAPVAAKPASRATPRPPEKPAAKPAQMTPEVSRLVSGVQSFYEKTKDFEAGFTQVYSYKAFKRSQTSSGKVVFKKPALMRWEYLAPSPRTIVLSSDKVYVLDPAAMTLTRANFDSNQLSASVTFLWGKGKLADEFVITEQACKECAGVLLALEPKVSDPRFQRVLLEVDPKSFQVLKSTVVDPDGSTNAIAFTGLKTNTGVSDERFKLTPPPGTQIQDLATGK